MWPCSPVFLAWLIKCVKVVQRVKAAWVSRWGQACCLIVITSSMYFCQRAYGNLASEDAGSRLGLDYHMPGPVRQYHCLAWTPNVSVNACYGFEYQEDACGTGSTCWFCLFVRQGAAITHLSGVQDSGVQSTLVHGLCWIPIVDSMSSKHGSLQACFPVMCVGR